ncbi:MAG: winged helix-turn-helix transcriptional regulator [Clostridia bacterium]|nr:winged helix-turn-helix transcriptional regulator [Clostridia bacterium]
MKKRRTLMRSVARARRVWNNFVKDVAMEEGIPDSYRTVLMYLLRHPGSGQRNIAEFAGITTSAVNQAVKNMLEEDFLIKETDASDKRNSKLFLTEKGSTIAARVFEKLDAADDAITEKIGAKKEAELIDFLDELTEYIRRDLSQC